MVRLEFTAGDLHQLLEQLGARVKARGGTPNMLVVGGAALALAGDSRRVTTDIDALLGGRDRDLMLEEAATMATELGLPPKWLNEAARAFIPPVPAGERVATDIDGVDLASDRLLLAMKLVAFRASDLTDLELLFTRVGIRDAAAAADLTQRVYGTDHFAVPERADLLECAEAILARLQARPAPGS